MSGRGHEKGGVREGQKARGVAGITIHLFGWWCLLSLLFTCFSHVCVCSWGHFLICDETIIDGWMLLFPFFLLSLGL